MPGTFLDSLEISSPDTFTTPIQFSKVDKLIVLGFKRGHGEFHYFKILKIMSFQTWGS